MQAQVHGIHHVTAMAGDAQENLDFYVGVMGMRLVKRSVNQDDPGTYHLFYADGAGTPGTDLTFFPWPRLVPAKLGSGLTVEVPLAIPLGSLDYWRGRFAHHGVPYGEVEQRFGEATLPFTDPHGLKLALVETGDARPWVAWEQGPVPAAHQIRGMHTVRLWERDLAATEALLTGKLGFRLVGRDNGWHRYGVDDAQSGKLVDVLAVPNEPPGRWGRGGVHHVAWRVHDDGEELALRDTLQAVGLEPTPQIDRFWFRSVYFREPGNVLFELATDGPGFGRDEALGALGEALILPPWLEARRSQIEAGLPRLTMPTQR